MGEGVRRDIIVKIRAESDLTHIDRTISRLDDLEKRVERLNPRLRLRVTADTGAATQNLGALAGRADLAARAMGGQLHPSARRAGAALDEVGAAAGHAGDTLQSAAGKVLLWSLASGAIYGTVRAVRGGIDAFSEIEAATVRLERVGRGFGDTQDEIASGARFVTAEILRQSVALGQSSAEAQEAAVVFARLGLTQRETADATRVAMLAANVAGIGAADAAKFLASAISQFQLSASDLPDVLDKLNTLENTTRVRTEDLLQAISRGGAVFREAGGSLEEFAGITAVVAQTTGRSGAEIGNAFKTIASRLASVDVQGKVFEKTGIDIRGLEGDLLPIGDLLGRLVVQFQNLSQAEQAEITTSIAGVRQRNILQASLDNYFKVQEQVIRQFENSGSAAEENAKILELLETKVKQLFAAAERLANSIGESGLGFALKKTFDGLRVVIDALADLGAAGALIVGAMGAYVAAVLLASTGTGVFSATLNALAVGMARVNAAILGLVTGYGAHATAAGASTAANVALARSNDAVATSAARAAAVQRGVGAAGVAGAGLTSGGAGLAIAGGAALGLGAVAAVRHFAGGGKSASPFEEGSVDFAVNSRLARRTEGDRNAVQAAKEKAETLRTVAGILADVEAKEASGGKISEQNLRARADAMTFLRNSIKLTADEQAKMRQGTLQSADVTKIAAREEQNRRDAVDDTRESFDAQVRRLQEQRKGLEGKLSGNLNLERSGGIFDRALGGDRGLFESFEGASRRIRGSIKETDDAIRNVGKSRESFEQQLAEQERARIERRVIQSKEAAKEIAQSFRDVREKNVIVRAPFAFDEVKRVRLEIEEVSREISNLQNQIARGGEPAFIQELEDAARKAGRELDRLRAKEQAVATTRFLQEREKLDTRFDRRQSRFAEVRAVGPDRDVSVAESTLRREQGRVQDAEGSLADLRRRRREAADFELARTAPGSEEEVKVKEKIQRLDAEMIAAQKEIEAGADRIAEAWQNVEVARERASIERRQREFSSELDFARRVGDAKARLSAVEGPEETRGIREAQALAQAEAGRVVGLRKNVGGLEAQQQEAVKRGEAGDQDFVTRDIEIQIQKNALQEAEIELQERLRQIELEKIEAARRLTEERQRQGQATSKELSGSSDIDLLRSRITAGRIERGEQEPIDQETFLGLDQETRRQLVRQGELFPGAKVAPDLDLGLGPGAFQRQVPGVPTPADLQQLFQNLNVMAPSEFRGAIQNAVLTGQTITVQLTGNGEGGGGVPEAAAGIQANFNFSGLEVPMDRLVNMLAGEFESRMQALVNSKIEAGEQAMTRPPRPARTG